MSPPGPMMRYACRLLALLRRRARPIAVFAILVTVFDASRAWSMSDLPGHPIEWIAATIQATWGLILAAALAPHVVEATSARGMRRILLSVLVTFLLVGIAVMLVEALNEGPVTWGVRHGQLFSNEAYLVRSWWIYAAAGLLFAAYCQTRDRELAAIRAVRDAELERADSQRNIVASRLQVLQARVEPELLFDALGDVGRTYRRDPGAAETLLDDLIAYLRAALPQMRGGASTLIREVALAEAYLKVVPAGRNRGMVIDVRIADDIGEMPFPPMVLLPLVHAVSEAAPGAIYIAAPATRTVVSVGGNSLEICVVMPGIPKGWEESGLPAIRGALEQYFGAEASLQIERSGDCVSAVMTWPAAVSPALPPAAATMATV